MHDRDLHVRELSARRGALSLVCCSVQERYGNEKIHRVLGVTSSQGTKTNQPTTIGSDEAPRAARRAAHQFELVV
jgi:hypothetical protein